MLRLLSCAAAMVLVAGCGGAEYSSVAGKVTVDGQAVPTGTVIFVPIGDGQRASGAISADGTYALDLVVGEYKVALVAVEERKSENVSRENWQQSFASQSKSYVPAFYGDPEKSPLSMTVTPEDNQTYDLVITTRGTR